MKKALATFAVKYRWVNIIFTAVMVALFAYKCLTAVILNDPDDWSNQKHPYVKLNKQILKEFGGANVLQIMLKVKDGGKYQDIFNVESLTKVKQISDELSISKGFIPPNFEGIAAGKVKFFKADPEMIVIEQLMPETPSTQAQIDRIKQGVNTNPLVMGKLVSKDYKATLMMADYNRDVTLDEIYADALRLKKKYSDANHEIMIAGKPVQMGWLNEQQVIEMPLAFLFLFIILMTILFISFRNLRGVFLPLLVGVIASVIGLGAVAWTGVPFNIISYGSPFVILAAGAAHVVQYLKRYSEIYGVTRQKEQSLIDACVHIMPPLVVSIVTDSIGFIVILFTPFVNLYNMALGSAAGLISFLYLVIFFVPAITSLFPVPSAKEIALAAEEEESFLGRMLGHFAALGFGRWKWRLFIPMCLLGVYAVYFLFFKMYVGGFDWDTAIYSNVNYRWKNVWVFQDQNKIAKTFSGAYPYNILIKGKENDIGKDPELLHQIEKLQAWLETRPEITYTISLPNYLKGMNILFHEGNLAYNKVSDDPLLNAQYLFMLSSGSPGEFETTVDTVYWKNAALKTLASCGNPRCYDKLVQDTHKWVNENWKYPKATAEVAGGFIGVSASMSEDCQKWLWPILCVLVLLVYTICALMFRHWIIPIFLVTPLLYMLIIMLGLLQYWTMSRKDVIDYNAQQFISLCLGVGIDANVYLVFRYFEELKKAAYDQARAMENAWTSTGKAVLFSALSLSLAYLPLCFTKTFWGYLGIGSFEILILNAIGSLVVLPIFLGVFNPKFLKEEVIK